MGAASQQQSCRGSMLTAKLTKSKQFFALPESEKEALSPPRVFGYVGVGKEHVRGKASTKESV